MIVALVLGAVLGVVSVCVWGVWQLIKYTNGN